MQPPQTVDELLAEVPTGEPRPRKAWSNTGVVGLSVREKLEGGVPKPYVQINWVGADGKRRAASYSVAKWGLRKALWNGCLRLYRERRAAGAPVEEAHVMFARAQEPFAAEIRAEQKAEARREKESAFDSAAVARQASPEEAEKREAAAVRQLESALFGAAVGPVFPRYFAMQAACGVIALLTALSWWKLGGVHRNRVFVIAFALATVAVAVPRAITGMKHSEAVSISALVAALKVLPPTSASICPTKRMNSMKPIIKITVAEPEGSIRRMMSRMIDQRVWAQR